jgi:hypothetical protein
MIALRLQVDVHVGEIINKVLVVRLADKLAVRHPDLQQVAYRGIHVQIAAPYRNADAFVRVRKCNELIPPRILP